MRMRAGFLKTSGLFARAAKPSLLGRAAKAVKPSGLTRAAVAVAIPAGLGLYGLGRGFSSGAATARREDEREAQRQRLAAGYA